MTEQSRVSGPTRAALPARLCAGNGKSANIPLIDENSGSRIARKAGAWACAATLVFAAFAAHQAQAQDQTGPATDTFASGSSSQVYQDAYSSGCDGKNGSSPEVDGYNSALCMKQTTPTGQCNAIGGANTTLAGQAGNTCYYCQPDVLPASDHLIVVPMDGANAAYQQGYTCSAILSDPACYLACYGPGTFKPPSGMTPVNPLTGTATLPPATGQPMKLQGYITNTPDPCYPAGPKNYWVCDYPNLPRPPGCTCSNTPPAQPPQQAQSQQPTNPSGQPTTQPSNFTPDPNNYYLGMMAGISNCIQSFPMLGRGMGYFMVGQFANAAASWGISGQSATLQQLAMPVTGSNVTPYQQGVIAGQRICALTTAGMALKGLGAIKNMRSPGEAPSSIRPNPANGEPTAGQGTPGSGQPGTSGAPGANAPPASEATPGEPSEAGQPTVEDTTRPTTPAPSEPAEAAEPPAEDTTRPSAQPAGESAEPNTPEPGGVQSGSITGGDSASNPIQGSALQDALTDDLETGKSNAPALAGKYIQLQNGPVKLGAYIGEGTFAAVYKWGVNQVIKIAKNGTTGYFNDGIEGQWDGSKILEGLQNEGSTIGSPETSQYQPGKYNIPGSLVADNTATKYPGSFGLSSKLFRTMTPIEQGQVLDAIQTETNALAAKGYILADINPANWTIQQIGNTFKAILHDPDMILTMEQVNENAANPTSTSGAVLNGSLGTSGAQAYTPGAYADAPALQNQLNAGLKDWLYAGPNQAAPAQ